MYQKLKRLVSSLLVCTLILGTGTNIALATNKEADETVINWDEYTVLISGEEKTEVKSKNLKFNGNLGFKGAVDFSNIILDGEGSIYSNDKVSGVENEEIFVYENYEVMIPKLMYEEMKIYDSPKVIEGNHYLSGAEATIKESVEAQNDYTINSSILNLNKSIYAKKNIFINNSLIKMDESKKIFIASEDGNITINGSKVDINGIIYAPNGNVTIDADEFNLKGRILAKKVEFLGNKVSLESSENDFDFLKDEEKPVVEITEPNQEEFIVTKNEYMNIKGTATDNSKMKKVYYEHDSELKRDNKESSVIENCVGIENWEIVKLPLDLGTNYIKIIAEDMSGNKTENKISVKRNNKEIKLKDNVLGLTESDLILLEDGFIKYEIDDNKTSGYSFDDKIIFELEKDNIFSEPIKNGTFKKNDIISVPESDILPFGFSGKLISIIEKENSVEYKFDKVELNQLFNDYVSLDMKLDFKEVTNIKLFEENKEKGQTGFQWNTIIEYFAPRMVNGSFLVGNTYEAIIYDKDGDPHTSEDQLRVKGEVGYRNISYDGAIEWNATWFDIAPKQLKSKLKWEYTNNISVRVGPAIDIPTVIQDFRKKAGIDFENNFKIGEGFKVIEGVSMADTMILGNFAVAFSPVNVSMIPAFDINGVANASDTLGIFAPVVNIMLVMDMSGDISLSVRAGFDSETKYEKGFNLQHVDYVGPQGGINSVENKGQKRYDQPFGRVLDIYDVNNEVKNDFNLTAEGHADLGIDVGIGVGVFFNGIMPYMARLQVYSDFKFSGKKGIQIKDGQLISGELDSGSSLELGAKIRSDFRLYILSASFEFNDGHTKKFFEHNTKSKDMKIILTWSDLPRDLDLHCYTPRGTHIYYGNKTEKKPDSQMLKVKLDVDDTNGFGPETTSVFSINEETDGIYKFDVKDFSNKNNSKSKELSKSRAVVKVYLDDVEMKTFVVPENVEGRTWKVFEYDTKTNELTSINKIINSYQKDVVNK